MGGNPREKKKKNQNPNPPPSNSTCWAKFRAQKKRGTQIYFHTCWQKGGICMVSILVAHVSFGTHLQHATHQYILHRISQVFSVSGALTWKTWSFQLDTNSCCFNFGLVHKDESIIWWVPGFRCFISLWVMIQSRNTATKSYPPSSFCCSAREHKYKH